MTQTVKNLPAMQKTQVQSLDGADPLEKGMATHSSILAWRILCMEEPSGLHTVHGVTKSANDLLTLHFSSKTCPDKGYLRQALKSLCDLPPQAPWFCLCILVCAIRKVSDPTVDLSLPAPPPESHNR